MKRKGLTNRDLQTNVSIGLTFDEAKQIIDCIDNEHAAHARAGEFSFRSQRRMSDSGRAKNLKQLQQVMLFTPPSSPPCKEDLKLDEHIPSFTDDDEVEFKTPKRVCKEQAKAKTLMLRKSLSTMELPNEEIIFQTPGRKQSESEVVVKKTTLIPKDSPHSTDSKLTDHTDREFGCIAPFDLDKVFASPNDFGKKDHDFLDSFFGNFGS